MKRFFATWPADVHIDPEQIKRISSARKGALTPISLNKEEMTGVFSGRHGVYQTSLTACECRDFKTRHLPCKHIYRLAHEMKKFDLGGRVVASLDAVTIPEEDVLSANRDMIANTISQISPDRYEDILMVLTAIRETGRLSTLDAAIDYIVYGSI